MGLLGGLILKPVGGCDEATTVIARMTGLTGAEESAITTFVCAEVANGNWALIDEFWCFGLVTEANALTGWFAKTATNVGATKGSTGFTFNGSSDHLQSGFICSVDGVNYTLNDALIEVYIKQNNQGASGADLISAVASAGGARTMMRHQDATTIRMRINSTLTNDETTTNTQLISISRSNNSDVHHYRNGVLIGSGITAVQGLPSLEFYMGARNTSNVPLQFFNGIISSALIGAHVGFNYSVHNTNMITLLTNLGVI